MVFELFLHMFSMDFAYADRLTSVRPILISPLPSYSAVGSSSVACMCLGHVKHMPGFLHLSFESSLTPLDPHLYFHMARAQHLQSLCKNLQTSDGFMISCRCAAYTINVCARGCTHFENFGLCLA